MPTEYVLRVRQPNGVWLFDLDAPMSKQDAERSAKVNRGLVSRACFAKCGRCKKPPKFSQNVATGNRSERTMPDPKLTDAQHRAMKWLGYGWKSEPGAGMAIHVNGKRICNVDTMFALQRQGLVEQISDRGQKLVGQWQATVAGAALIRRLCL